ncbi:MAG: HD domain-containing protein [Spirochaetia bacterium]|jgi:HD superfamily phosphohydrolase|nr:HD domain-containing protein [Spirochaetia bacterium]
MKSIQKALSEGFDQIIRDPVWSDIAFDDALLALSRNPAFRLLDGIRQLGPVALVYPGATHSRRAHSLGVYHIARRFILALSERGRMEFASPEGARAFLAAALCHDLGHFPYAHSLKELPLASHEAIAGALLLEGSLGRAIEDCGADPEQVAAIIDWDRPGSEDRETLLYRRILSGVLDPDKIDYLTRDAYFCGVPYGIQDADFILRRIDSWDGKLRIDHRGMMSVEAILFSKYQMYRSVYWHTSVRCATAMVKKSILAALNGEILLPEQLYGLDDAAFARLLEEGPRELFQPALDALDGRLYRLVADIPFDPESSVHSDLNELEKRLDAEATLAMAANLQESEVLIDIPEPIGFETDLDVETEEGPLPFSRCSALFGDEGAARLVASLRRIRIFVHSRADDRALTGLAAELLT